MGGTRRFIEIACRSRHKIHSAAIRIMPASVLESRKRSPPAHRYRHNQRGSRKATDRPVAAVGDEHVRRARLSPSGTSSARCRTSDPRRLQGKGRLIPTLAQQFAFAWPRPRPRSLFRSIQRFHNPLVLELLGSSRQVPHAQVTRQC